MPAVLGRLRAAARGRGRPHLGRARAVHQVEEGLGDRLAPGVVAVVVDEQHVQVAGVGHLRAAQPAHAHDGERHGGADHLESSFEERLAAAR